MHLKALTLIGMMISIVTGITVGVLWHQRADDGLGASADKTLGAALREVQTNYVHNISEEQLIDFAISGMMQGLDEHSDYLNKRDFKALEANTTGEFGGIGIELGLVDDLFTVIAPIDNTPADRAGIRAGDRITSVEGVPLRNKKLIEVIRTMRGKPGTELTLKIQREEQPQPFELSIVRETIKVSSIKSELLEPGIGYLRISQFQTNTSDDLENALETLVSESATQLEGVILDLRNNPGGTLVSSVEVVDLFLNQGLIVSTKGRLKSSSTKYRATHGDQLAGAPMVVIINGGSASASEVVAGALQDHGRATLIGSTSYGKGSVQSVVPLNSDQALKITTAHYFTPLGRMIHQTGIQPDVALDLNDEELMAAAVDLLRSKGQDQQALRVELAD
ncbi:MAG: S41 family peptidase [Pseudomonadota bacterium]